MNPLKFAYKALRALLIPKYRFAALAGRGYYDAMPDDEYLKRAYKYRMGRNLDLNNPQTFNEKLQWLKLYDRRTEYTNLVDKYEAKKIIAGIIGEKYIIPTLGVYDSFDEIKFQALPEQFVLKCTHDSGSVYIIRDKNEFNFEQIRIKLQKSMSMNYFVFAREWAYKNIKPRIIAEKYIDAPLTEYKIFCFNGKPRIILVCKGPAHVKGRTNDYYDAEFNHLPLKTSNPNSRVPIKKPEQYTELLEIAAKLSRNIPQVRVDLYLTDDGRIFSGEMTFYHEAGYCKFNPEVYDAKFGELIALPQKRS